MSTELLIGNPQQWRGPSTYFGRCLINMNKYIDTVAFSQSVAHCSSLTLHARALKRARVSSTRGATLLPLHFQAHAPQASSALPSHLARLRRLHQPLDTIFKAFLRYGDPLGYKISQIHGAQLAAEPRPVLFHGIEIWRPWCYLPEMNADAAVCCAASSQEAFIIAQHVPRSVRSVRPRSLARIHQFSALNCTHRSTLPT